MIQIDVEDEELHKQRQNNPMKNKHNKIRERQDLHGTPPRVGYVMNLTYAKGKSNGQALVFLSK